jgi:hypothetical protein
MSVWDTLHDRVTAPTVNDRTMHDLIGITIRTYDPNGEELGEIHLPTPVLVGDVAERRSLSRCVPSSA